MASNAARPVWVKQAEEAKLKEEQEKSAAAWEAFNSTFKDVNVGPADTQAEQGDDAVDSDSEEDEAQILANKPIGPVDPGKCTAAGTGVAGGAAGAAASFVIVTKDSYGRRIPDGGAQIKVKVIPAAGVSGGEVEQEAVVKDHADGTYTVTYAVAKRGNFVVSVECNGMPILNSPFPVFFSGGTAAIPLTTPASLLPASFANGVAQNPYLSGGLPGMYSAGVPNMQVPLAPSAAAMAAAQAIMAARAYEAQQAREAASGPAPKDSKEDEEKQKELLARTLQVSNLSSMLNADQLKKLFSFCGTVTDCKIDDSKQLAYVEYANPEEAKAALALNNMGVGGRHLNVEMAKSLPSKKSSNATNGLPVMMQQAVAIQQFQFQQALLMQQAVASQQAALQAATAKTASETAAARAAEISRSLNITGVEQEEVQDVPAKSTATHSKRSKSPSPIRYRPRHRSRSLSRSPIRYRRSRRSRSRSRDRPRYGNDERGRAWFYRSAEDYYRSRTNHFRDREREYEHRSSHRRSSSRSKRKASPRSPKSKGNRSRSPRLRTENKNRSVSPSPMLRTEEKNRSRSRSHSPRQKTEVKNRSRSRSPRQRPENKNRSETEIKHHSHSHSPRQRAENKNRSHSHSPRQRTEGKNRSHSPRQRAEEKNRSHSPRHTTEDKNRSHSLSPRQRTDDKNHSHSHSPKQKTEEICEKVRASQSKVSLKRGHDRRETERTEKASARRREPTSPITRKVERVYDDCLRISAFPKEKTPEISHVVLEEPDERFEVVLPAKASFEFEAKQPDVRHDDIPEVVKVSKVDERGRVDVKERRHHDRKHRRDDDNESKEKRKRRHKHRSRRSSSDSADGRKNDREDGSHRKSSKKRSRRSKSASVSNSGGN
ncbi:hypothetical protein L7F22_034794 [Adiantum nelumboides]|nr:hypothetical protein [Adiantum nelumboides]